MDFSYCDNTVGYCKSGHKLTKVWLFEQQKAKWGMIFVNI